MVQFVLNNKAGLATQKVARLLSGCAVGERIPTVAALEEQCQTARGNIQLALRALKDSGAITLEPHGQSGTILTAVDYVKLAEACGVLSLVGAMPLPYTKRYEGIATGLFLALNNEQLTNYIAFMRGSEARIRTLLDGRANYCIMSRLAFSEYSAQGCPLQKVMDLGPGTYVGRHVLLKRPGFSGGWQGARVGIDASSVDQSRLTRRYFADQPVRFVPVQYTQILPMLLGDELDAGIWNEDDLIAHHAELPREKLILPGKDHGDDTCAVIVARAEDTLVPRLLHTYLDAAALCGTQQQVMEGKIAARY